MNNKIDIPIWVLNLEREKDKLNFMSAQLDNLGQDYQIIQAIDGQTLSEDDLKIYSKTIALRDFGRELKPGEIGCALSHIKMWQKMLKEKHEAVLILEDDVHIGKGLFEIINNRDKLPKDYQHINFSTKALQNPFGEFITDIYRASNHAEKPYSTCAYLLTQQGAKLLLELIVPVYMPVDNFICISGIKSYGIYPKVVLLADSQSSIGTRWDNMPKPNFFLRKFRQFKDILKAIAIFLGFSKENLVKIHLRLNKIIGKLNK